MAKKPDFIDELIAEREKEKQKNIELETGDEEVEIIFLSKDITLSQVKEICKKYLYLPDDNIIDFILAVYISNFTEGERLWTWLIGPPSVGKTEIVRALFSEVSLLKDSLTAKTLFSGLRIGGKDPSLFKRINGKVLIIKDFTKILSGRPEDLAAILGQLRCAYDGYFDASTGAEVADYHYETNFTLIAGVTPAIDDHYSVYKELGERFITWRIENPNMKKLSLKVKENKGRKMQMRQDLKINFGAFIKKYRALEGRPLLDDPMAIKIGELAELATWARTPVTRFGTAREIRRIPQREGSARLFEQLLHLGESLALVRDKQEVTEYEYNLLYKIAFNSVPPERIKIIEFLLNSAEAAKKEDFLEAEFWVETPEIGDRLNFPTSTARIILDDLLLLGILERQAGNTLSWRILPEFSAAWVKLTKL